MRFIIVATAAILLASCARTGPDDWHASAREACAPIAAGPMRDYCHTQAYQRAADRESARRQRVGDAIRGSTQEIKAGLTTRNSQCYVGHSIVSCY